MVKTQNAMNDTQSWWFCVYIHMSYVFIIIIVCESSWLCMTYIHSQMHDDWCAILMMQHYHNEDTIMMNNTQLWWLRHKHDAWHTIMMIVCVYIYTHNYLIIEVESSWLCLHYDSAASSRLCINRRASVASHSVMRWTESWWSTLNYEMNRIMMIHTQLWDEHNHDDPHSIMRWILIS